MRILRVFGICLIIVTLAVGVEAARDRGERNSRDSKITARSSESRSSSDRQYSGSRDRQNSSPSYSSNRGSSSSLGASSKTSSAYRPNVSTTPTDARPTATYTSTQARSAYRPGGSSDAKPSIDSTRRYEQTSSYRPAAQPKVEAKRSTSENRTRDIYSVYRPNTGERSERETVKVAQATKPYQSLNQSYRPDTNNGTLEGKRNGGDSHKTVTSASAYRPDNKPGNKTVTRSDNNRSSSAYKPEPKKTVQSIRDRKLAASRTSGQVSYKPAVYKPQFTYATRKPPASYKPPTYKSGRYYYSHPHYNRPYVFGYWAFDYYPSYSRRSLYFHYGLFPYVQITRIIVRSYPAVVYVGSPIYIYGGRYEFSRYPGLDAALADIRSAWISGRMDLLDRHVSDSRDIAILLDGRYDYSVTPYDYVEMTEDALGEMDTISFVWEKVQTRSNGEITAFAAHTYRVRGVTRKTYVSYTLRRFGSDYYIVEVGSGQRAWY